VDKAIEILQTVLATEIVCMLCYTMHAVAERINQLGGKPDFNPEGLASRAASEYGSAGNLVEMIKENLIAERIAIDHYRELIRYFGDQDPGTCTMLEGILVVEEEHANDMHDLLVAHEGKPMLPG
jgi:bacterioferritin